MRPRNIVTLAIWAALIGLSAYCWAGEPKLQQTDVGRGVGGLPDHQEAQTHPIDPVLALAHVGLAHIRTTVRDYTTTLVRRERIKGQLTEEEFTFCKIRNRKVEDDKLTVPFAIYMKFLKPPSVAGREAIWVEGADEGKLIAHEVPGLRNIIRAKLNPKGFIAMNGSRYPITDAGLEALVVELIENGKRDRQHDECEVRFFKNAKINDRVCTLLQVKHPVKREHFDYHLAQIFIDDELHVPVRYAAYSWPAAVGGKPVLEEEYTYMDLRLNVGLTDDDFSPDNKEYQFP